MADRDDVGAPRERPVGPAPATKDPHGPMRRDSRRRRIGRGSSATIALIAGMSAVVALWLGSDEFGPGDVGSTPPPTPTATDTTSRTPPTVAELPDVEVPHRSRHTWELAPLDEPTVSLVVATYDGSATFIDVDARVVIERDLPQLAPGDPIERLIAGDRLVLYGAATTYAMDPDPDAEPEAILEQDGFSEFVASGLPDRVWVWLSRSDGEPSPVIQVDVEGRVLIGPTDSPGGHLAAGLRDLGVLQESDQLIVWDPDADRIVERLDGPFPVATDGERLAWCDADCQQLSITNPWQGMTQPLARLPDGAFFTAYEGQFSPDGRYLATGVCVWQGDEPGCGLAALDLEHRRAWTVAHFRLGPYSTPAWSPDSNWIFVTLADGQLAAYQPGAQEVLRVPVHRIRSPLGFGVVTSKGHTTSTSDTRLNSTRPSP